MVEKRHSRFATALPPIRKKVCFREVAVVGRIYALSSPYQVEPPQKTNKIIGRAAARVGSGRGELAHFRTSKTGDRLAFRKLDLYLEKPVRKVSSGTARTGGTYPFLPRVAYC